jgi:hypothetical protein
MTLQLHRILVKQLQKNYEADFTDTLRHLQIQTPADAWAARDQLLDLCAHAPALGQALKEAGSLLTGVALDQAQVFFISFLSHCKSMQNALTLHLLYCQHA